VGALTLLMDAEHTLGEVYNVGNTQELSIRHLAERVRSRTGSSSEIVHVPFAVAYEANFEDMPRRVPAIDKIQRAVGWYPNFDLDEILNSVIAFYREDAPRLSAAITYDVSARSARRMEVQIGAR